MKLYEGPANHFEVGVAKITQSFASRKIRVGDTWKICLNATVPAGHMKAIFSVIEQPGVGEYPVSITKIKEENCKGFSGYIYLNTATPDDMNFVNLTLTAQIQDMAGHFSAPVISLCQSNPDTPRSPLPPGSSRRRTWGLS